MGRSGRKRKAGRRHPSGQLVRDKRPDDKVRCGRQPHRRMLDENDRTDERAESPLGQLLLRGLLNRKGEGADGKASSEAADRYEAGMMYLQIVNAYRAVIGAPRGGAGSGRARECEQLCSAAHELLNARQRGEVHAGLFNTDTCPCLSGKWRYDSAFETLTGAGQPAARAVARVAVHREAIAQQDLVNLVNGLDVLRRHFGLTARRPREHSRNA
jgi:hypothetical protein